MGGSDSHRISANRVGLFMVVLLLAWMVASFYPRDKKAPPRVDVIPVMESKLHAVGLADNPDWEGLPEFFAVWAEHAGWKDDKAQFAYWDQRDQSYAYFFEATRENGKVRFRSIPEPQFIEGSGSSYAKIYVNEPGVCMVADSDLKTESPEHPFVFFVPMPVQWDKNGVWRKIEEQNRTQTVKPKIKVELESLPLELLKP
jgi:hypothetical protein